MAKKSRLSANGTGADHTNSGKQMTVEPIALYSNKHEVIGYMPMIKCLNAYGRMTTVAPALVELEGYYKGDIDADTMKEWGLNTPEGAMDAWNLCGVADSIPSMTTSDAYIAGAILEGGYMRSIAKINPDVGEKYELQAGDWIPGSDLDAGESAAEDGALDGTGEVEYELDDIEY